MNTASRAAPLGLLIVGAVLAAPLSLAARLPDWAKTIAENPPSLPVEAPKHEYRILFSETRYAVQRDGRLRVRVRRASEAFSSRAQKIGWGTYRFDRHAQVESARAWHLPLGERAQKSHGPPVDVALNNAFLSDEMQRFVRINGIKRGSIVFFEFEATDAPTSTSFELNFFEEAPTLLKRIEIETPPGWTVRSDWLRHRGPEPVVTGNVRAWELRDLPEAEDEPLGESPSETAPLLVVSALPPTGVSVEPGVFLDWASFSTWFEAISKGRDEATPEVVAAAKSALQSAGTESLDRTLAAASWVRDRVRYVAEELGVGNYVPRPASQVLSNLYGDCKDKGTLLRSILAAEGIPSYPVLVNLTSPETVSDEVAAWGFNHFIIAVPLPSDTPPPARIASAVSQADDLGPLLFIDPTDEWTPIGALSDQLAGKRGLLIAGPRGRLVTLPVATPSHHRIDRVLHVEVLSNRSLTARRESRLLGAPAAVSRRDTRASAKKHRESVERRVTELWTQGRLTDYSTELETVDGEFIDTIRMEAPPLPADGPDAQVLLFPGASEELPRVPIAKRKTAVVYSYPRTITYEVEVAGIPASSRLPVPRKERGAGWAILSTFARTDGAVHARWELTLERTRFDPDAFEELKKLWSAITSTASSAIKLSEESAAGN